MGEGWVPTEADLAGLDDLRARVSAMVARFKVLADWNIIVARDGDYHGEITFNEKDRRAYLKPWWPDKPEPPEYVLHEVLHAALRAVRGKPELDPVLIGDLCGLDPSWVGQEDTLQGLLNLVRGNYDGEEAMIQEFCLDMVSDKLV